MPETPDSRGVTAEAPPAPRHIWHDVMIVLLLMITAFASSFYGARRIDPIIVTRQTENQWFDGDIGRVFDDMSDRGSDHYRTKVHPLFSLLTYPPVSAVRFFLRSDRLTAVRVVIALLASAWISLLFVLLRLIGHDRLASVLFSFLAAVSASAMFWFVVPETFPFGSASILAGLAVIALAQRRTVGPIWYTLASALTLSFSTSNWMVGIFATFAKFPWRRAVQITVNAFCLVVLLWGVEKFLFPSVTFFLGDREEGRYMLDPRSGGPMHVAQSFVFHSIVMPGIREVTYGGRPRISIQAAPPGSGSLLGAVAVSLWSALLALGIWGFVTDKKLTAFRLVLGLSLLGQLALHLVYGSETFSYAIHFAPLLIVLAAFGALTRARPIALVLTAVLVILAGINNGMQFEHAAKFVRQLATQGQSVDHTMDEPARSGDWGSEDLRAR